MRWFPPPITGPIVVLGVLLGTAKWGAPDPSTAACATSSPAWQNFAVTAQTGTFGADFDVTPNAAAIDGTTGFGPTSATGYSGLAVIVRFNTGGTIDVRSGGSYTAATALHYTAGTSYHVHLDVNVPTHTYSVAVTTGGMGVPVTLATNAAFRTEQAGASSLGAWSLYSDQGTHTVCNMALTGATPPPPPPPSGNAVLVMLQPQSATLYVRDTLTYQAVALDATGKTVTCALSWSSSAPTVAKVVRAGVLTGVAAGFATVTATCPQSTGNVTGSAALQVIALGTPISASRIQFGGTIPLLTGHYSLVLLDSLGNRVGSAVLYIFGP